MSTHRMILGEIEWMNLCIEVTEQYHDSKIRDKQMADMDSILKYLSDKGIGTGTNITVRSCAGLIQSFIAQWVEPNNKQSAVTDEVSKELMFGFIDWLYSAHYSKYWGSDEPNNGKWYKAYTMPDRKYYTLSELFELSKGNERQ